MEKELETLHLRGLNGNDDLDNQKCPKCNEVFDFTTERGKDANGCTFIYRAFERQKHICKK